MPNNTGLKSKIKLRFSPRNFMYFVYTDTLTFKCWHKQSWGITQRVAVKRSTIVTLLLFVLGKVFPVTGYRGPV